MAIIEESIFRVCDIRGVYPEEINEEAVFEIADGFIRFLNLKKNFLSSKKIIVAQDSREGSASLKESVISAILARGLDIFDFGSIPTPLFYFAINKLKAAGGVMITASHNPDKYNGLKLARGKAIPIAEKEILEIKNLLGKKGAGEEKKFGKIKKIDLTDDYINFLIKKSKLKQGEIGLKIAVDPGDKENEKILFSILENLKIPLDQKSNLKFVFDRDGDRLYVFSNKEAIRSDLLAGLIIRDFFEKRSFLKSFGKQKFIYDLRFTKAIPEFIEKNGGEAISSRVGHSFVKKTMREEKAIFGAELSGHFYFKESFFFESPILAMLKILKILKEKNKNINDLIKQFQIYFHSGEISLEIKDSLKIREIIEKIKNQYSDGKISYLDGITIEYPDWWFNFRPSNTEPVLRLVVEAKARYIMEQKVNELVNFINSQWQIS